MARRPRPGFFIGLVDKPADFVAIDVVQAAMCGVGHAVHELLALAQRLLGRLAARDVKHRGLGTQESALGIAHDGGTEQHRKAASVAALIEVFHILDHALAQELAHAQRELGAALGAEHLVEVHGSDHLFAPIAQPAQLGVVDVHEHRLRVQGVVAARRPLVKVTRLLQGVAQEFVGAAQVQLRRIEFGHVLRSNALELLRQFLALPQSGDVARDGEQTGRSRR